MDLNKNLEKYADLLVRIGLNLHAGDNLTIRLSEDSLPLARLVAKKAYQAGVGDIQLMFTDDSITLDRFLEARDESFETYPEYQVDFAEKLFLDNHHVLSLLAPNPDLLKPADPARIAQWQKVAGMANKRLMKYTMQNKVKWCVAAAACPAWADAAFPGMPGKAASAHAGQAAAATHHLTLFCIVYFIKRLFAMPATFCHWAMRAGSAGLSKSGLGASKLRT